MNKYTITLTATSYTDRIPIDVQADTVDDAIGQAKQWATGQFGSHRWEVLSVTGNV